MPPRAPLLETIAGRGLCRPAAPHAFGSRRQFSKFTAPSLKASRSNIASSWTPRRAILSQAVTLASIPTLSARLQSTSSSTPPTSTSTSIPLSNPSPTEQLKPEDYLGQTLEEWTPPANMIPGFREWGYLKEILPDTGLGPTSMMKSLFEAIWVNSSVEYWAAIAITAALFRLMLIPLQMRASENAARMSALGTMIKPLTAQMQEANRRGDQIAMQKARSEMSQIYQASGVKISRAFVPMLLHIPGGFALWRLTRQLADSGVPGMESGGTLWFQNLTTSDPYFLLPMAVAVFQHLSVRTGVETMNAQPGGTMLKSVMLWGLPCLSLPFIGLAPAAVQLNFLVTAVCGLVSNLILRTPAIRSRLGMTPMYKASTAPEKAYKGTINVSARAKEQTGGTASAEKAMPTSLMGRVREFRKDFSGSLEKMMPDAALRSKDKIGQRQRKQYEEYERKRKAEILQEQKQSRDRRRR